MNKHETSGNHCLVVTSIPCRTPFPDLEAPNGCCECGMLDYLCYKTGEEANEAYRKMNPDHFDNFGNYLPMRYFYHYGRYFNGNKNWVLTSKLIEVDKEFYEGLLKLEQEITAVTGLPQWHAPVAYRHLPNNITVLRSLKDSDDL